LGSCIEVKPVQLLNPLIDKILSGNITEVNLLHPENEFLLILITLSGKTIFACRLPSEFPPMPIIV
jgi:hypothetical protein